MKIKVPLQCHRSAIESAVSNKQVCSSDAISAISAVELPIPLQRVRTRAGGSPNAQKPALMALTALAPTTTCGNQSAVNGTETALP